MLQKDQSVKPTADFKAHLMACYFEKTLVEICVVSAVNPDGFVRIQGWLGWYPFGCFIENIEKV